MARQGVDLMPEDWGALYVDHYRTNPAIGTVARLVVHHTATNYPTPANHAAFLRQLEAYGHSRDGADIEYHALIANGQVAEGYAPRIRGCHCVAKQPNGTSYNVNALGIAFIGYYYADANHPTADPYRPADGDAFVRWVVARIRDGDLTRDVLAKGHANGHVGWFAHNDVDATACPGTMKGHVQGLMDRARAELEGTDGRQDDMTDEEHAWLLDLWRQQMTPFEAGSSLEGVTPRWALDVINRGLTDEDVTRIASRVVDLLSP